MGKLVKILSIDSGGMRGIIPAMILAEIERKTKKSSSEVFDLICGSSTGGILAGCLVTPKENGKPKFSGESLVKIYEEDGPQIFSNSLTYKLSALNNLVNPKYPSSGMEKVFERNYGNIHLKDALTNLLIPAYEIETGSPFLFKSADAKRDEASDFLMKDVIMATCAAPTYFEPVVVKSENIPTVKHLVFADGSLVASNPTMCAYVEAKKLFPDGDEYLIVSLGTGDNAVKIVYDKVPNWGAYQWVKPLIDILLFGSVDVVDDQMKTLFSTSGDPLNHYYRFQLPLTDRESPFDNPEEFNIHNIEI